MILMTGKELASEIKLQLAEEVALFDIKPKLVVIQVGDNPASNKYISMKEKAAQECGIDFELLHFDLDINASEIREQIFALNRDNSVTGIIVQLPLPDCYDSETMLEAINPDKDVDGLTKLNQIRLKSGESGLFPATAEGVINLLRYYRVSMCGANAVVIGRSKLVGSPVAIMLEQEGANVTICHSKTKDIAGETKKADIIISAVGKTNLITSDMVQQGVVIVDVGMDVDFENVFKLAGMITPPIGGVGPMTVAMLLSNVVKAAKGING